jgi:hypothetical protein
LVVLEDLLASEQMIVWDDLLAYGHRIILADLLEFWENLLASFGRLGVLICPLIVIN